MSGNFELGAHVTNAPQHLAQSDKLLKQISQCLGESLRGLLSFANEGHTDTATQTWTQVEIGDPCLQQSI